MSPQSPPHPAFGHPLPPPATPPYGTSRSPAGGEGRLTRFRRFRYPVVLARRGIRKPGRAPMDLHAFVTDILSDERLLANLVAIHIGLGLVLIVSILCRNAVLAGGGRMLHWVGLDRVDGVSEEAARTVRSLTFW